MRPELADMIRCPACADDGRFTIDSHSEDEHEIVEGKLRCEGCGAAFPIRHGYLDFLHEPSPVVLQEQAAQERLEDQSDSTWPDDPAEQRNYVLDLPTGNPESVEHAPMVDYAVAQLDPTPGMTVLDLGSGFSWTSAIFARRGCHTVALDVYAKVLAHTRAFVEIGCYFDRVLADMSHLPFQDGRFDIVFANAAVHHTPELAETMRQAARVLKPGGRLAFVNEPVVGIYQPRRQAAFGAEEREQGINEGVYTTLQWQRALRNAGLEPRLHIAEAGIAEKARRRRRLAIDQGFPRKQLTALLERPWARKFAVRILGLPTLYLYPFNVFIFARKPATKRDA